MTENEESDSLFWSIIRYARPFKGKDNCGQRDCNCRSNSLYSTLSILPTIEEQRESITSSVNELGARAGNTGVSSQDNGCFKSILKIFCCFNSVQESEPTVEPLSSFNNGGRFLNDAHFIAQGQFY